MARYEIRIDNWHPPLFNKVRGKHWSVEHKMKVALAELIGWYAAVEGIPKADHRRRVALRLAGWPQGRLPDRDAFDKMLLDALVITGQLVDDGPKWLEGRVDVELTRAEKKSTVIILEDCDGQ